MLQKTAVTSASRRVALVVTAPEARENCVLKVL